MVSTALTGTMIPTVPESNAGTVGIMVPVSALLTIGVGRLLYKRGVL